ncbi:MAG: hypothetical protein KH632_09665, partial [Sutterella wadsworthensis]|nr:hypothetical protein [Sutterella wadsworthensis]
VAKQFGVRPATLFQKIRRTVAKLPEQLRPKRILFWDVKPETSLGTFRMAIEKLSDIPADRPLTLAERMLRERINYLPNERKNDLPQQVTKHDGRKT